MAIKTAKNETMKLLVKEMEERYAKKSELGTLAAKNEVSVSELASELAETINGKAEKSETLDGYGITDAMTKTAITQAIAEAIAGADHLRRKIVESTDQIQADAADADKYIYMVKKSGGKSGDTYDEYMIVSGELERVGDWAVDLSQYATVESVTQKITEALTGYAKTDEVTAAIGEAVTGFLKEEDFEDFTAEEVKGWFSAE